MKKRKTMKRILATVCFECCNVNPSYGRLGFISRPIGHHPALGESVEVTGRCSGCPISLIRGNDAPIGTGKPSNVFKGQLLPGDDCVDKDWWLTSSDMLKVCAKCERAGIYDNKVYFKNISYCLSKCPAREMIEVLSCLEIEARIS